MSNLIKKILMTVTSILVLLVVTILGYVIYMSVQYYRIEDAHDLTGEIKNNTDRIVSLNENYKISTYNIGFGAYSRDFSFFMDRGEMLDGTKITGTGSRAKSKQTVLDNTNGAISIINHFAPDFMFFQEVDIKSTRSYQVNQKTMLENNFPEYGTIFASNFHSGYLFYPFIKPHGKVNSGIITFSKYKLSSSIRYKLPIDESFINKFVDLDRCYMVSRTKINDSDKELVLINIHMSAYDKGVYRQKQLELLKTVLQEEKKKGNYVIVGGDFNHDIASSLEKFKTMQKVPEWVYVINEEDLGEGYKFASSNLNPTCRSSDMKYVKGINYTVTVDGFIVSNNVEIVSVENVVEVNGEDVEFLYSDHNPVVFEFSLKNN